MKEIAHKIETIAKTDTCVIIIGEYNTGKGWTARAIHTLGKHSKGPFYEVYCIAMQPDKIKREFFGHIKYTNRGAIITHQAFERANDGTLFIDGFTALPNEIQMHIINIMEQLTVNPILNEKMERIDTRLILSIDNESYNEVKDSEFWDNLLSRINPIMIQQPPLRERREDIPWLIDSFLKEFSARYDWTEAEISPQALYRCIIFDWPGNIRQLKNAMEYALVLSSGGYILPDHLPPSLKGINTMEKLDTKLENSGSFLLAEHQLIKETIKNTKNKKQAAEKLGLSLHSLQQKLDNYSLGD